MTGSTKRFIAVLSCFLLVGVFLQIYFSLDGGWVKTAMLVPAMTFAVTAALLILIEIILKLAKIFKNLRALFRFFLYRNKNRLQKHLDKKQRVSGGVYQKSGVYVGGIKKLRKMTTFPQILIIPAGADNREKIRLLFIKCVLALNKGYVPMFEALTAREIAAILPGSTDEIVAGYESARYDVLVRIDDDTVKDYSAKVAEVGTIINRPPV